MRPEFYIFGTICGWGLGAFLYKFANNLLHPMMVLTIGLCFDFALLPFIWMFVKFDHTTTPAGIFYTLAGSLFMCVGTLGFSYALRSGGAAGQTTILTALYPALTLGLSMLFLGEALTLKKGIGILLAFVSFILLSLK